MDALLLFLELPEHKQPKHLIPICNRLLDMGANVGTFSKSHRVQLLNTAITVLQEGVPLVGNDHGGAGSHSWPGALPDKRSISAGSVTVLLHLLSRLGYDFNNMSVSDQESLLRAVAHTLRFADVKSITSLFNSLEDMHLSWAMWTEEAKARFFKIVFDADHEEKRYVLLKCLIKCMVRQRLSAVDRQRLLVAARSVSSLERIGNESIHTLVDLLLPWIYDDLNLNVPTSQLVHSARLRREEGVSMEDGEWGDFLEMESSTPFITPSDVKNWKMNRESGVSGASPSDVTVVGRYGSSDPKGLKEITASPSSGLGGGVVERALEKDSELVEELSENNAGPALLKLLGEREVTWDMIR